MTHNRMVHLWAAAASYTSTSSGAATGVSMVIVIIYIAISVFYAITMWRVYEKAGQPGWAVIIPIYNAWVLLKIVGRPGWWIVLLFIPFVNIVFSIIILNDLSKSFGHGGGFTVGLLFLSIIFFPILAFGNSRYLGPAALQGVSPSGYPGSYGPGPGGPGYSGSAPYGHTPYGPTPYGGYPGSGQPSGGGGFAPGNPFAPQNQYGTAPGPVTTGGPSGSPAGPPPGWYGDPSGRHQQRYWDGATWTDHVVSNNVQSIDPLPPAQ